MLQSKADTGDVENAPITASNTNLERISDWLTAIIIGASLVQLKAIGDGLDGLASRVSDELNRDNGLGYSAAYFGILYFSIGGFIFAYLFTRIKLVRTFTETERRLRAEMMNATTREQVLLDQVVNLTRQISAPEQGPRSEGDQNRGRFGGSPRANGRRLGAKIAPLGPSGEYCNAELHVVGESGNPPLLGKVTFYLHETFKPHDSIEILAVNNEARCSVVAWGAFIVGALCDDGRTRLELDLSDPALGGPDPWRTR